MHRGSGLEGPPPVIKAREEKTAFLDQFTASKVQAELSYLGELPDSQPTYGDMPLSEKAKAVLSAAFKHADGGSVTPLHLLWGVLADEESPTAKCLVENDVTRERVAAAMASAS